MASDKPAFPTEYENWLATERKVPLAKTLAHYAAVTLEAERAIGETRFWKGLLVNLKNYDAEYQLGSDAYPLIAEWEPKILIKPFQSFLEKTYRKNVVTNEKWPDPPEGGWWLPPDWLSRVNDILRTTLVVKYLDGVPFLVDRLKALAKDANAKLSAEYVSQQDGYYAAHLYYRDSVAIPKLDWETETRELSFEIQITTQIKDVIKRLLHSFYETQRVSSSRARPPEWNWNYKSDEFVATYLGHILHYVDGMIVEVREKTRKATDGSKL